METADNVKPLELALRVSPENLPQGPRFRLIGNEIALVNPDTKSVHTTVYYSGRETLDLADHFPQQAIFPGCLLLEAISQAGSLLTAIIPDLQGCFFDQWKAEIENRQKIPAPAIIHIGAHLLRLEKTWGIIEGEAFVRLQDLGPLQLAGRAKIFFKIVRPSSSQTPA